MNTVLRQWSWTNQLVASAGVAAAGSFGVAIGGMFEFQCPLASFGLACAGCGCSRAVTIAVQDGVIAAFERQPSALLLVAGLIVSVAVSAIAVVRERRDRVISRSTPRIMLSGLLLLAAANLAFQLNANL